MGCLISVAKSVISNLNTFRGECFVFDGTGTGTLGALPGNMV